MLNNTSVKTRLILLCIIPISLLIVVAIISIYEVRMFAQNIDSIYEDRVVPLKQIKVVSDNYAVNIVDLLHKYRAGVVERSEVMNDINGARTLADEQWQAYLGTKLTAEEERLVGEVERYLAPVVTLINKYMGQIEAQRFMAMDQNQFVDELYATFDPLSASYSNLIDLQLHEAQKFRDFAQSNSQMVTTLMIGGVLLTVVLVGIFAWLTYRSIHTPLKQLQGTIAHIAQKADLTVRAEVTGNDELAQTAEHFNQMLSRLHTLVTDVMGASLTLSSASEQMQMISEQVASTATQQEAQSAMIATAITQMSAAIQEVAHNALTTSQRAEAADQLALQGGQTIENNLASIQTLSAIVTDNSMLINKLHEQSNEINQVVLMIQGVAEQTNLLALNAAIEAARAGESGRGFAVVADEVRTLAHNTQQATENINRMINALQDMAQQAVSAMQGADNSAQQSAEFSQLSADAIEQIRAAVAEIVDMNLQVSTATEQQTTVAAEINENITEFNDSISSVSQSSQQNADASKELSLLAVKLQDQVSAFVI
ncbi:methyl-accepting chemotaxis protein [Pseudoalteromonas pernae]|uniref:methyl-accepting chemotaxis protein n=1 Tax=Pseudoalteromonas pernae TaxID=3118054 RepID=UPI003242196E